jgi:hypothetical protein
MAFGKRFVCHALWGGRFDPIVMADRLEEAHQLIELYRADALCDRQRSDRARFPSTISAFDRALLLAHTVSSPSN